MKSVLLAILGLINAIWLIFLHYLDFDVCLEGFSCSKVIQSPLGLWFGIPVAVFGAGFFVFVILREFLALKNKDMGLFSQLLVYILSFCSIVYFVAVQIFVIKSFCLYCLMNHILVFLLILFGLNALFGKEKSNAKIQLFNASDLALISLVIPLSLFLMMKLFSPLPRLVSAQMAEPTIISGKPYPLPLLDIKAKLDVYQNAMDLYQIRKNTVETLLFEMDAQQQGLSLQDYYKKNIFEKIRVSESELQAHLENHQKFPKEMPLAQKRQYAQRHVQQEKFEQKKQSILNKLYERYSVKLNLPKPNPFEVNPNAIQELVVGNEAAKLSVVMFSDFQCPACKQAKEKFEEYLEIFPNQIKIAYRHYPLKFHPYAKQASYYSVCLTDQELSIAFNKLVFENQKQLNPVKIKEYAKNTGANMKELSNCLAGNKAKRVVSEDQKEADRLGLNATPFILINGQVFKKVPSKADIQALLDNLK